MFTCFLCELQLNWRPGIAADEGNKFMLRRIGAKGLALSDRLGLLSFNVGLLKSCNAGMDSIDLWSPWNDCRFCVC